MNILTPYNIWTWRSFTPTGLWTTNTTYTGRWRRVGDSMEFAVRMAFAGTPDVGDLSVNIPSGFTIDTTKLNGTTVATQVLGHGRAMDAAATGHYIIECAYNSTTSVALMYNGTPNGGFVNRTNPFSFGAGGGTDEISIVCVIPILGWAP